MPNIARPDVVYVEDRLRSLAFAVFGLCLAATLPAAAYAQTHFAIVDGSVRQFDQTGQSRTLDVGGNCADLWVSPNMASIAFIAVNRARQVPAVIPGLNAPVVERSSIYYASKADNFKPTLAVSRSFMVDGRSWETVRNPSVSPDGGSLFFTIPYTMTTQRAMRLSLASGRYEDLGDTTNYCVIWGGPMSGRLILQGRHIPESSRDGITYRCYLRDARGQIEEISDECSSMRSFADSWTHAHGGECKIAGEQE
jgi:hypothetical protein